MKLRCVIKRQNSEYVGLCLELSLATKAATIKECRIALEYSIEEYIKTLSMLSEQHKKVRIRPVEHYFIRKILFDIRLYLHKLCKKGNFGGFIKRTVVPLGV